MDINVPCVCLYRTDVLQETWCIRCAFPTTFCAGRTRIYNISRVYQVHKVLPTLQLLTYLALRAHGCENAPGRCNPVDMPPDHKLFWAVYSAPSEANPRLTLCTNILSGILPFGYGILHTMVSHSLAQHMNSTGSRTCCV